MYVAAGSFQEALAALREAQQPEAAALFVIACREIHSDLLANMEEAEQRHESQSAKQQLLLLSELSPEKVEVIAADELYGQYQRKLVHLCMDSTPSLIDQ